MNASWKEKFQSAFPDAEVMVKAGGKSVVTTRKDSLLSILAYLKDLGFDHLTLVSCVDWIDEGEFELVYILSPYMLSNAEHGEREKQQVILKTRISRAKPEFQTVTHVFENAEPYEREIHELYGVHFEGHERLIPLLLERDYEIPPFRKDFDTREYVAEIFENIPPVQDGKA